MIDLKKEKELFEKWNNSQYPVYSQYDLSVDDKGEYIDDRTIDAFSGWIASTDIHKQQNENPLKKWIKLFLNIN